MRLIFMGTPDFAKTCLAALTEAGHEVVAVYSQPPRKSGRGHKVQPSPVHAFAQERGIEVRTPTNFKDTNDLADFRSLDADLAIVVAYGLILPQPILNAPKRGCINVHASLLPRWRGAAPIQRAIEAGDQQTGVGIMQMEVGLDTGPLILERAIPIAADETGGSLHDKLADLGATALLDALAMPTWKTRPQDQLGTTYASKLDKAEATLDWQQPAEVLERRVRAFNPFPMCFTELAGQRVKVLSAQCVLGPSSHGSGVPGQVLDNQLTIACGQGALQLTQLQPAGKSPMPAKNFLNGRPITAGELLT